MPKRSGKRSPRSPAVPSDGPCRFIASTDYRYGSILNLHAFGKHGALCVHLFPPYAQEIKRLTDEQVAAHMYMPLRLACHSICMPQHAHAANALRTQST